MVDLSGYPALQRHLLSAHCNGVALTLTGAEAADQHHHEHHGPGGIRNHDETSLHWDPDKANEVLTECARDDSLRMEELLRRADVTVTMAVGEHTHGYVSGQGWTVCPDGETCTRFPRQVEVSETRSFDGRLLSTHQAAFKNANDLIARGVLNALTALSQVNMLATDPDRRLDSYVDIVAGLTAKAGADLRQSLIRVRPMLYPEV